jgi:hypothetical protein
MHSGQVSERSGHRAGNWWKSPRWYFIQRVTDEKLLRINNLGTLLLSRVPKLFIQDSLFAYHLPG